MNQRAAIDVIVDGSGRLGPLSYLVPDGCTVECGAEVEVPFGKAANRRGVVLGQSADPSKATREIAAVTGVRAHPGDMELATEIAQRNFVDVAKVAERLTPNVPADIEPADSGDVVLASGPSGSDIGYPFALLNHSRRLLLVAPGVDTARVAAMEASVITGKGQVLILCPTKKIAGNVAAQFESGAARLDVKPKADDLSTTRAFAEGKLAVGIGTRAAVLWPAANLAAIIVVDEDHPGHVEAAMPNTNVVDVAAERATVRDCDLVVLGRVASAAALATGSKVGVVGDPARHWPTFEVLDTTNYPPAQRLLPPDVERALQREWDAGRTPVMVTPSARTLTRCARCKIERIDDKTPCSRCQSTAVAITGTGPERVAAMFRNPVNAVSMGELRTVKAADLVVIMSLDSAHHIPTLVPHRPPAALLVEAARVAGPNGKVIVCTDDDKHPVVSDVARLRDLSRNARRTWDTARELNLPPYGRLVTIKVKRAGAPNVADFPGQVLGPRQDGSEWEILIQVLAVEVATTAAHGPVEIFSP